MARLRALQWPHRDAPHNVASVPDVYGPGFTAQMTYYETTRDAKVFAAGAFSLAREASSAVGERLLDDLVEHMEAP